MAASRRLAARWSCTRSAWRKRGSTPCRAGSEGDEDDGEAREGSWARADALDLVTGASHHFVSSSLASQAGLLRSAGTPFVEIHPTDAAVRGICDGDPVIVENGRGWCRLRAVVTDARAPGRGCVPQGALEQARRRPERQLDHVRRAGRCSGPEHVS